MRAYVGQTRSRALIARLLEHGVGECSVRGELPPRRRPFFYDNGAFRDWTAGEAFDVDAFQRDFDELVYMAPDFVVAPDLVAQGLASLAESLEWARRLGVLLPLYLAVQDGMTPDAVAPHVSRFAGLFVGGSLDWKLDTGGAWVAFAHDHERPCHVGRVGIPSRIAWARSIGADSIDSSYPLWCDAHMDDFLGALGRKPNAVTLAPLSKGQRGLFA